MTLAQLLARLADIRNKAKALQDKAIEAGQDLSAEDAVELDNLLAEGERVKADISRAERLEALAENNGNGGNRQSLPEPRSGGGQAPAPRGNPNYMPPANQADRDRWGWESLQSFARAVRASFVENRVDPRLLNAPTTYGQEAVGPDGGFAVPPDWRARITSLVMGEDALLPRCDAIPTESNAVTTLSEEDSAWSTSGGIRVYTRGEAAQYTSSKPALKEITVKLNEIYAFVPLTDELVSDAPMLESLLTVKVADKINFKANDLIVNGTGAAQPLGIMNSPALITVSKEASQAAATLRAENIFKMYQRMPAQIRGKAVWLYNQDIEQQLYQLALVSTNIAGTVGGMAPMFLPPGGMVQAPNGLLMGREMFPTETCQTLGTVGDIIFAYLPGYYAPYKASGIKSDVSMHLYFDTGHTAFRWQYRFGGQPWLSSAIARKSGTNTLSHFIALQTR